MKTHHITRQKHEPPGKAYVRTEWQGTTHVGYSVWRNTIEPSTAELVEFYPLTKYSPRTALHLANARRDLINGNRINQD